jgi:predicted MFS family arabinose efflux permease
MKRVTNLYRNAYSRLSPATWWLSIVMLVNRAGTMVIPFMTLYLTETKHYPIGKAGLVMSIFGMGAVCGGFIGGKLTDKLGFYNIQLSALLCGGVMFLLLGTMESFSSICICSFVLSLLNDSFRPANATAIAEYSSEENRTRSYSLNRLSINLGWAVGGAVGGIVASRNYHLLFWIDGLTNIGAALLLMIVLAPQRNKQTPSKKDRVKPAATRSVYKDNTYLFFILLTILFGCCFFQIFSTMPVYFKQRLGLTPNFIGLIMAFNGLLIACFEMAIVFTLEPRGRHIHFITIGTLLMGLSFVVFNIVPGHEWLAVLSTIIVTCGEMLAMPFMNSFWISRTDYNNRGQYAGLYTAAWSISQIVGPYIGSQTAQHLDYHTLWWGVGGVSIIAAIGFKSLQRRQHG